MDCGVRESDHNREEVDYIYTANVPWINIDRCLDTYLVKAYVTELDWHILSPLWLLYSIFICICANFLQHQQIGTLPSRGTLYWLLCYEIRTVFAHWAKVLYSTHIWSSVPSKVNTYGLVSFYFFWIFCTSKGHIFHSKFLYLLWGLHHSQRVLQIAEIEDFYKIIWDRLNYRLFFVVSRQKIYKVYKKSAQEEKSLLSSVIRTNHLRFNIYF